MATGYADTAPRDLIPQLCVLFFRLGWVTGTGGGVSIRSGDEITVAPSGVQKEAMRRDGMFVYRKKPASEPNAAAVCDRCAPGKHPEHRKCTGEREEDFELIDRPSGAAAAAAGPGFRLDSGGNELSHPLEGLQLRPSQCTPLFFNAFIMRGAGAVIHTHSRHAVLAAELALDDEVRICNQEMIKGVRNDDTDEFFEFHDDLVIPVIDNTPREADLRDFMLAKMRDYPAASAILVRHHGVYVWGEDWVKTKTMCECLDYLFQMTVDFHRMNLTHKH
jgi:methylthioribulose-1-phosphate dehydratase